MSNDPKNREETQSRKPNPSMKRPREAEKGVKSKIWDQFLITFRRLCFDPKIILKPVYS